MIHHPWFIAGAVLASPLGFYCGWQISKRIVSCGAQAVTGIVILVMLGLIWLYMPQMQALMGIR